MTLAILEKILLIKSDKKGATIVEFAFIAPILILSIMGVLDVGYRAYTVSMLQGAIQKASRDSSLEGSTSRQDAIDGKVSRTIQELSPNAVLTFERLSYSTFGEVGVPEDYTDTDNNGMCDNGEPFEDVNRNGTWDEDRGINGQGGARDAVLYTVTATYPRAFPMAKLIGLSENETITASTVLKNQPYGSQTTLPPLLGNCI